MKLRHEGVSAYAGTDAGPNVHEFTLPRYANKVNETIQEIDGVSSVIHCSPGEGTHLIEEPLEERNYELDSSN